MMTECDEVAAQLAPDGIRTFSDAVRAVTQQMGPPSEIGYQLHDNIAEALWRRAVSNKD